MHNITNQWRLLLLKEGMNNIFKDLQDVLTLYKQELRQYKWNKILKVLDQVLQNVELDFGEFIDMGIISMGIDMVLIWVYSLRSLRKQWSRPDRKEMSAFLWEKVDEGFKRLRKVDLLEFHIT